MSRYIDADRLKERIPKDIHEDVFENCSNCELLDDEQVKELIDLQPTADVRENVRGEWIDSKLQQIAMRAFIEKGENWKVCSVCGTGFMIWHQYEFEKLYHDTFHNFCPNCGADMRGKDD